MSKSYVNTHSHSGPLHIDNAAHWMHTEAQHQRIHFRQFLIFGSHVLVFYFLCYSWSVLSVLCILQLAMERTPSVKAAPCAPETMGVWTASQNSSCFCGGRGWGSTGSVSTTVRPDTTACAVQSSTCALVSLHLTSRRTPTPPSPSHCHGLHLHPHAFPNLSWFIDNYPEETHIPPELNGSSVHTGGGK